MELNLPFFLNSFLLGIGLAMDAFSVSIANALAEPNMKRSRAFATAGTFAFFQFVMPFIGWLCVRSIAGIFARFEVFIPYVALALLGFIGGKAIYESMHGKGENTKPFSLLTLFTQGLATSIDALSVGFTTVQYRLSAVLLSCAVIAAVTFLLCMIGIRLGKQFGKAFKKAELFGGIILIAIGVEIFLKGILK